jgi:hypothetical protein
VKADSERKLDTCEHERVEQVHGKPKITALLNPTYCRTR